MIRGTQKQIIHLKNPESPLFEEAFLIMKKTPRAAAGERTMVEEATRLLTSDAAGERTAIEAASPKRSSRSALLFFSGALCGAVLTAALFLLF